MRKNSTFQMYVRILIVVMSLLTWLTFSRYLTYKFVADGYYLYGGRDEAKPNFLAIEGAESSDWILGHLFGFGILFVGAAILWLAKEALCWTINWVINGKSKYVDPCKDPKCPCPRHAVERQQAADAASIAAVAAASAATTAVISST